jgi:hypothetical protein
MTFANDNVRAFAARTEVYREYGERFRAVHGPLAPYSRVRPGPGLTIDHEPEFVTAMIRWLYRDPTLELDLPPRATTDRRR